MLPATWCLVVVREGVLLRAGGIVLPLNVQGTAERGLGDLGSLFPTSAKTVPEKMGTDHEVYVQFLPQKSLQIFAE